jgi:ABC-type transport system involved in multi-copper enzyme maturation permease subunit
MFVGPLCYFELVRMARRGRLFALRFAFGLILLGIVGFNYLGLSRPMGLWSGAGALSIGEMARFGEAIFASIMAAQAALVLGLTPALVADAIASERQRKTLDHLLASPLKSGEIVLGKLASRLLGVGVFPALVLPIMSLLTLIGGVSPAGLVLGYAALASSAYFLAGLALLASVLARRPRDAIGAAYSLTAAWLFIPPLLEVYAPSLFSSWPELGDAIRAVNAWVWPASPLGLVTNAQLIYSGGALELARLALWMVGSQLVYGTIFMALATWQLRPAFRRHEGRDGRLVQSARLAGRWFPIRPCGDDPVFWKEAYFSSAVGGPGRKIARAILISLLGLAVVWTLVGSWGAFREVWEHGYGWQTEGFYDDRMMLNVALRYGGALLTGIWLLWLSSQTAAGISSEREQDTWISLLATPLDRSEILRGKMLGPLRATAHCGVTLGALWLIGCAAGAVHPLGLLNGIVMVLIVVWFATALGTFVSLKSKITWKSRMWTLGILIAPHFCCAVPIPSALTLVGFSLWSYAEIHAVLSGNLFEEPPLIFLMGAYYVGGMALYAGAAYFLTRSAFRRFSAVTQVSRPPPDRAGVLAESKPAPKKDLAADVMGLP